MPKRETEIKIAHVRSFPGGTSGQECASQCKRHRDAGLIPGSGRAPGGGHGNLLQYSYLENPMDSRAWWATVQKLISHQPVPSLHGK